MATQVVGFVLRSQRYDETITFYKKLGLEITSENHGGPEHFACTAFSAHPLLEVYKLTANFLYDALIFQVENIRDTLINLDMYPEIKRNPEMQFAYITDPEGRSVMLIQKNPDNG